MKVNQLLTSVVISFPVHDNSDQILQMLEGELEQQENTPLDNTERESIGMNLDEYRPFLATALNEQALAVLGDFDGSGADEVRMFQLDMTMAHRMKECWELLKEVRFVASVETLSASGKLQNPEAFFGRVRDQRVIVFIGDTPENGESVFYAFVEAPELLCSLGKPKLPN